MFLASLALNRNGPPNVDMASCRTFCISHYVANHFAAIAAKRKHVEYREQKPYWRKRLEGRTYDVIKFRNGYSIKAPEMLVEFRGLRRYGKGRDAYYAILLGRVLKMKHWHS